MKVFWWILILPIAVSAYFTAAAPAAAQSDDQTVCFSTNSDNWKKEEFYARGLAACNRAINSHKFSGKSLAFYLRAKGYWLRLQDKLDDAIVAYNRAVELDPQHVEGYDFRATVWQSMGNNDRAIADFGLAIRVDPTYAPAYYRRGYLYQKMGKLDLAKSDYNTSLALPAKNRIGEWAHQQASLRLSELAKDGK